MAGPPPRDAALLGMDARIDRRDFIAGAIATGALAGCARPNGGTVTWTGYGGEGDYAAANGNTESVRDAAHAIRDGGHARLGDFIETSERYDVVIVGGGLAGLAAARTCRSAGASCLLLDNHAMFGGEAKQNEFLVDGHRLIAPQGSNDAAVPEAGSGDHATLWRDLGIPEQFEFVDPPPLQQAMRVGREHFVPMYWNLDAATTGYFFRQNNVMVRDMWRHDLDGAPLSPPVKADFRRWLLEQRHYGPAADRDRWLDSMTYGDLLTRVMGLGREVVDYVDPILAVGAYGVSADAVSAYAAAQLRLPGAYAFEGHNPLPRADETYISFPGGNAGIARYLVKRLIPAALHGPDTFEAIIGGTINFTALDRADSPIRIRLGSTAVAVRHTVGPRPAGVEIVYAKDGRRYRVSARSVVMATGGWITKHVVRDLPDRHRAALDPLVFGPILVVNVALRDWRFLERLGISAARWFEGFGFFASIRRPMRVGRHTPPFDPGKPTVLTMYVGFPRGGMSAAAQSAAGRQELLDTDFAGFELKIRRQLSELFARAGFDARRDIAGIVLNRWGHAYVAPQPGFYFGSDDAPAPSAVAGEPFGRIAFGHSQLRGHQNWIGAISEGSRAAGEALSVL